MALLDRRYGPWTGRVWGLILNLVGNAMALYGAVRVLTDGSGAPYLIGGLVLTVICIAFLASPSADRDAD